MNPSTRPVFRLLWLLGAGLLVFAARSHEVHLYAGDVPYLDQWKAEGADILQPWLAGSLGPLDFLRPHNGHVPVWSRLLVWLETALTGRWDPRIEMSVNAAIHSLFVVLILRWIWSALDRGAALAASGVVLALALLPFAWENITWGFQSQFPLALVCLILHVPGVLNTVPYSRRWWWAQAAGFAGLFTLGIMWTAPLAVGLVWWWSARGDLTRTHSLPSGGNRTGGFVLGILVAVGMVFTVLAPTPTDSALFVRSLPVFLHAWFFQLGWPTTTALINAPLVLLALQLRGRRDAPAFDRTVLALGIWSVLQAAAIAYARSAEYIGFTSRYGDLLAIGLLANFLALLRLIPAQSFRRGVGLAGMLVWLGTAGEGLYAITTTAHTAYFHQHAAEHNALRAGSVAAYARDGDIRHLADERVQAVLFPDPAQVAQQLARPALRALLPVVSGPSRTGEFVRNLQAHWAWLGALAVGAMLVGLAGAGPRPAVLPELVWQPDPWRLPLLAGLAVASFAGMFLWPRPFIFGEVARKTRIIRAAGTIAPLQYAFMGPSSYSPGQMEGAAPISPGDVRNIFHGPVDLAGARSTSFVLVTPFLIVPFAGDPTLPGMALQVVVEDDRGGVLQVYTCPKAAASDVDFWEIDTHANQKRSAHLAMVDESSDSRGWIAAASPQYAWKPGQGASRARAWAGENHAPAHQTLGLISLLAGLGSVRLMMDRRRNHG